MTQSSICYAHRKYLNRQVATERLRIVDQECVDQTEELHDAFILPQVFMALEQEHVLFAVAAHDAQLSGPLLGRDDLQ